MRFQTRTDGLDYYDLAYWKIIEIKTTVNVYVYNILCILNEILRNFFSEPKAIWNLDYEFAFYELNAMGKAACGKIRH